MSDVIVVGSGAAGLSAALAAAQAGAKVTVLERDTKLGGSTALSGGLAWLPANHLQIRMTSRRKQGATWRVLRWVTLIQPSRRRLRSMHPAWQPGSRRRHPWNGRLSTFRITTQSARARCSMDAHSVRDY